jgi:drug/metabolite transporter (DMT)-like permease
LTCTVVRQYCYQTIMTASKDLRSILLPNLALLTTVGFWGLSFVSSKFILNTGLPPLTLAFFRFFIASVIFFPISRAIDHGTTIQKKDLIPLIATSLFGITIYFFFETTGIKLTSASNAALIIASIPIFTIIAEYIFYKTAIHWYKIVGVFLSIGGVYLIISRTIEAQLYPGVIKGNLFMLGACLSWVGYIIISKRLRQRLSGVICITYQFIFGTIFLFPLAIREFSGWFLPPPLAILNLLYLGIACSALGYFLYLYGLSRLEPVAVSTYTNLVPVIGTVGGVLILNEKILGSQIIGGAAIIIGIVIVNLKGRK